MPVAIFSRVPADLAEALETLAADRAETVSAIIREALVAYVASQPKRRKRRS